MATLRRLARGAVSDLRARPVAIVHGAVVLLSAWLLPVVAGLAYVWANPMRSWLVVPGFVLVYVLALVPVVLADLVVVHELSDPAATARSARREVARRWRGTLPWAVLAAVGLVPMVWNPFGGGLVGMPPALASPLLALMPSMVVLLLTVPYALTMAVPVVVAGGHEDVAGGFGDGVRAQWHLLRRAPGPTIGVAVLGGLPIAVAEFLLAVGGTLTLVGLAIGWLVAPLLLAILGLPILLLGVTGLPVAYAFARALAVRATVVELAETQVADRTDGVEVEDVDVGVDEVDAEADDDA